MGKEYLNVNETIKTSGVSRASLYRYIGNGLPYIEQNGHKYFNQEDIATFLKNKKRASNLPKKIIV